MLILVLSEADHASAESRADKNYRFSSQIEKEGNNLHKLSSPKIRKRKKRLEIK